MKYSFRLLNHILFAILLLVSVNIFAGEMYVVEIKLENHRFMPEIVKVPAKTKIKLVIHNMDPTIEEFDSPSLKREKILRSKSATNIILAPLAKGRYDFVGEFHEETAKGVLVVE